MSKFNSQLAQTPPLILLYDTEYMTRNAFAMLVNQTGTARIIETGQLSLATDMAMNHAFQLIIIGISAELSELDFIKSIRNNLTLSEPNVPMIVMVSEITTALVHELKSLNVTDILLKPTRLKNMHAALMRNVALSY